MISQISYAQVSEEAKKSSGSRFFINFEGVDNVWSNDDIGTIGGVLGMSFHYESNNNIYSFGFYHGAEKYVPGRWFGTAKAENYNISTLISIGYGKSVFKNKLIRIIPAAFLCIDSGRTRLRFIGLINKWEAEWYSSAGLFSEVAFMTKRAGLLSVGLAPYYYVNSISHKLGIKFILSVNLN